MNTCGSTAGYSSTAKLSILSYNINFNCRIAATVKNLAGMNVRNVTHNKLYVLGYMLEVFWVVSVRNAIQLCCVAHFNALFFEVQRNNLLFDNKIQNKI